ncbi:MAG: hypothetical protein MOGMAGMI_01840 [Candidatus Omnitrophica bacterium]|nr:hypothetical protein [Ignavibacteriaceae bacterium]MCG3176876.1 hypothetical protein [Candidatus Omnitrophota bacterium]
MQNSDQTNEKLIGYLIESHKQNTHAFHKMSETLALLNDTNKAYLAREDGRYKTIEALVSGNNRFIQVFTVMLFVLLAAIVIIAGAKEALKFIPVL